MRNWLVAAVLLAAALQIEGCYYMQAIRGQMVVLRNRQPILELIADETLPEELRAKLAIVQEARDFAVDELQLPDNKSYRTYRDLGRDYVVWNVFAAPEFSLEPKTWCFPVAGCVAYRGYFAEAAARKMAADLESDGYDVAVGGVAAYSTLGKFADPLLNTMLRWSDQQLVSTLFHELAHQKIYVKGDTEFNESFATAVADIGIDRWLAANGQPAGSDYLRDDRVLRRTLMVLVEDAKTGLNELYGSELDNAAKRSRKQEIMDELSVAAAVLVAEGGAGSRNWLAAPLNNARLASLGLYEGRHAAFEAMFRDCERDLQCFYAAAEALAKLDKAERDRRLEVLAGGTAKLQNAGAVWSGLFGRMHFCDALGCRSDVDKSAGDAPGFTREPPMKYGIGSQDAAYVAAGLVIGNVFDPDSRIEPRCLWQPRFDTQRAGIVGGGRQHRIVVEALEHFLQVQGA
jgi:predicted aminopeptidase